jgi:type IV pilus assembly protein PilO
MDISFKESPWYIQALIFVALAILLLAGGEYVPGSPVASARDQLQMLHQQDTALNQEVSGLQVYERRYAEFTQEMNALNKQLETLKTIVPEDKEADDFMRMLQGAAVASGVKIRSLTTDAVVPKEYHYEMPFDIAVDGPYYNIVDFFGRLSRLSRIINVGDLKFSGLGGAKPKFPVTPNTTITGICTVTTFFTSPSGVVAPVAATAPARPGGPQTAPPAGARQ